MDIRLPKSGFSKKVLGVGFLLAGVVLLLIFSIWRFHQAKNLSFNTQKAQISVEKIRVEKKVILPTHIIISSVGIDIDVKESAIVDGVWQVSPDTANHLNVSSGIGSGGNIVIYGHNKNNILGRLRKVNPGAKIELTGQDTKSYLYLVEETITVSPDDLQYVLPKDEEVLTVYTCTGFGDAKRFIVVAKREM